LQPLRRFPFDAAILFSDILIVPHAIGQELTFVAGEGPRLAPPLADASLDELRPVLERLEPIWATVARVKEQLASETTFLGFAGSPWTVATYMVAGQGSREQAEARSLAYQDPGKFEAGSLAPSEFERWVIEPTSRIVGQFRARHPGTPIIGFPKGAGGKLRAYADETGIDAIGIDETVDPSWAARELPPGLPVQGNLDPVALIAGGEALRSATMRILDAFAGRPHIFNLGHGIHQTTPIEHVEELVSLVKG
jgi:uroporphyrinogen decarboxylase